MLLESISPATLREYVADARRRTLDLFTDLTDEQRLGPALAIVNPPQWEVAHVAWFQEKWVLRHAGRRAPFGARADALYDSMAVPHDTRWDLPLLSREETIAYLEAVRDAVIERCESPTFSDDEAYFVLLSVLHEDMHTEAFTYTRQTHGWTPPRFLAAVERPVTESGPLPGDVALPGGCFLLGAEPGEPFVFDNEKWAHAVEVPPFRIARAAVTQDEFREFVEADGYQCRSLWDDPGWQWRSGADARHPVYWRRDPNGGWQRRDFDRWVPLEPHRPVLHVNWYEASAYCRWAGRRLPTEVEWEMAASWEPGTGRKRRYPWGDAAPDLSVANLDWRGGGCVDVAGFPAGDSAAGCRQMLGNVWEWTATPFGPYPGFVPDPYKEYSEPWFHDHQVLRGGCWATRSRLIRSTWRNFYKPDRRDVWAGFRTCAVG
jgi:iron(II)-dependent oxidoreductase